MRPASVYRHLRAIVVDLKGDGKMQFSLLVRHPLSLSRSSPQSCHPWWTAPSWSWSYDSARRAPGRRCPRWRCTRAAGKRHWSPTRMRRHSPQSNAAPVGPANGGAKGGAIIRSMQAICSRSGSSGHEIIAYMYVFCNPATQCFPQKEGPENVGFLTDQLHIKNDFPFGCYIFEMSINFNHGNMIYK